MLSLTVASAAVEAEISWCQTYLYSCISLFCREYCFSTLFAVHGLLPCSVIFFNLNENENGEKQENNEFVNEN